ncbi:MAG: class I SAM-dependent methyltransferase [Thioalkalivibrio sp.]
MNPDHVIRDRQDLRAWYASPPGEALKADLCSYAQEVVPQLFGYHALQMGDLGEPMDLLEGSRIIHRVSLGIAPPAQVLAQPRALPIQAETLDVAVLAHVLEYCADPHQVLREVERALIPEGHVLIVGFNPFSLMGLRRLFAGRAGSAPWSGRYYGVLRLKDWLRLLGFEVIECVPVGFRPPIKRAGLLRRLRFMETLGARFWPYFGGAYVIRARKRVTTLTPMRPRWSPRRRVAAGLAGSGLRRLKP